MRHLWVIEECESRKWRAGQPWCPDSAVVAFLDKKEALKELEIWKRNDSRVRLVKYTPVKK